MKLNIGIIRSRSRRPLSLAKFLDLSGLELAKLAKLEKCENMHWLIAQNNRLEDDEGIEHLKQLWYLDLSNNKISYVSSLSMFLALGTLILSNNDIRWVDLEQLRNVHLLSLSLHGNSRLDSDPYYRIHVIDCLPLIWELDGRLVTVTERLHVKQFFIDTAFTKHPVRQKLGRTFQTTAMKNIGTEGIVSQECKYIYSKFPMSETHTKHTDERRLKYLTRMVELDILQWAKELKEKDPRRPLVKENFLTKLLEVRYKEVERCNMVLLLLVISLQFQLPITLVRGVLNAAHIDMVGFVNIMPFFLLPRAHRTRVISVLLNAAKVDRDNNVHHEGGLYPQLFMCMYHTVGQLTRISQTSPANMNKVKPIDSTSDYMALMACEVLSLMLEVPRYYYYLGMDTGVIKLTHSATDNIDIIYGAQNKFMTTNTKIGLGMTGITSSEKKVKRVIIREIQKRLDKVNIKMTEIPVGDRYLSLSDSLPIKPLHSVIWASQYLTSGQIIPNLEAPILNPVIEAAKPKPQQPKMGENILLGPQVVGVISMLLEGDIAMVKIDAVPVSTGAVESKLKSNDAHYTYVDLKLLCYAKDIAMWRPIITTGDKFTIHSTETSQLATFVQDQNLLNCAEAHPIPLIYTPRTRTQMIYQNKASDTKSYALQDQNQSSVIIRHVMSAGPLNENKHNLSFNISDQELNEVFQDEEDANTTRKTVSFNPPTHKSVTKPNRAQSAPTHPTTEDSIHKDPLLLYGDNVNHIQGFMLQDDTSGTYTLSATTEGSVRAELVPQEPVMSRTNSPSGVAEPQSNIAVPDAPTPVHVADLGTTKWDNDAPTTPEPTVTGCPWLPRPQSPDNESDTESNEDSRSEPVDVPNPYMDETTLTAFETLTTVPNDNTTPSAEKREEKDAEEDSVEISEMEGPTVCNHSRENGGLSDLAGDACPICPGNTVEKTTFLTSVTDQREGLNSSADAGDEPVVETVIEVKVQGSKVKNLTKEQSETSLRAHRGIKGQSPVSSYPKGVVNIMVSESQRVVAGCRLSAMDAAGRYCVNTHPPTVISPCPGVGGVGVVTTSVSLNGGLTSYNTDFQQHREEAWRSTSRRGKPRPHTAVVQQSSSTGLQFPPPQHPTSHFSSTQRPGQNPGLKVTHTEHWLGGGRDLYWEAVTKRPKSGHISGWKEGLPESMKRQRPKSAYITTIERPYHMNSLPSNGPHVASCASCRTADLSFQSQSMTRQQVYELNMTNVRSYEMNAQPIRPLSSPIYLDEGNDSLPHIIRDAEIRSGLYIQGHHPKQLAYNMRLKSAPSLHYLPWEPLLPMELINYPYGGVLQDPDEKVRPVTPTDISKNGADLPTISHVESDIGLFTKSSPLPSIKSNEDQEDAVEKTKLEINNGKVTNDVDGNEGDRSEVKGGNNEQRNDEMTSYEKLDNAEITEHSNDDEKVEIRGESNEEENVEIIGESHTKEAHEINEKGKVEALDDCNDKGISEVDEVNNEIDPSETMKTVVGKEEDSKYANHGSLSVYSDHSRLGISSPDQNCYILNGSQENDIVFVDDSGAFHVVKPPFKGNKS